MLREPVECTQNVCFANDPILEIVPKNGNKSSTPTEVPQKPSKACVPVHSEKGLCSAEYAGGTDLTPRAYMYLISLTGMHAEV